MSTQKVYSNPIHLEKLHNNSLKVNFTNEHLIIGKSFFKNNTIYINNMNKTIFYFIKNNNSSNLIE
jgi:hypothetical protein